MAVTAPLTSIHDAIRLKTCTPEPDMYIMKPCGVSRVRLAIRRTCIGTDLAGESARSHARLARSCESVGRPGTTAAGVERAARLAADLD